MKKLLLCSLSAAILATSMSVYASDSDNTNTGLYVSGAIGGSYLKNSANNMQDPFGLVPDYLSSDSISYPGQHGIVPAGSIAIGYNFYDQQDLPFRLEFNFTGRGELKKDSGVVYATENDPDTGLPAGNVYVHTKTRMFTEMVNFYYDFHNSTNFTPFIMLGGGMANIKYSAVHMSNPPESDPDVSSGSKNRFAYNIGVGGEYQINQNLFADVSLKYTDGGKITTQSTNNGTDSYNQGVTSTKVSAVDALVGIRYEF